MLKVTNFDLGIENENLTISIDDTEVAVDSENGSVSVEESFVTIDSGGDHISICLNDGTIELNGTEIGTFGDYEEVVDDEYAGTSSTLSVHANKVSAEASLKANL